MWSCIGLFSTIIKISMSEIDKDQYEYLKQKYDIECGASSNSYESPTSRIINGLPSKETYPWFADVIVFFAYDPKCNPMKQFTDGLRCGGAIISDKVILTAGHCVCNGIMHPKDIQSCPLLETCVEGKTDQNEKLIEVNQNREGFNELHIRVGERAFDAAEWRRKRPEFDPNIEGYVYKYSRPNSYDDMFHTFSENGDIGIVIKRDGLSLAKGRKNIVPICLPSPEAFTKKNGFEVKLASRGLRYKTPEYDEDTMTVVSSCLTNEGTTTPKRNFAPCKLLPDDTYCHSLLFLSIKRFKRSSFFVHCINA